MIYSALLITAFRRQNFSLVSVDSKRSISLLAVVDSYPVAVVICLSGYVAFPSHFRAAAN